MVSKMSRIFQTVSHFSEHNSVDGSSTFKSVNTCNTVPFLQRCSTGSGTSLSLLSLSNEESFSLELHFGSTHSEPVIEIQNHHPADPFEVNFRAILAQGKTVYGEIHSQKDLEQKNTKIIFTGWNKASEQLDPALDLILVIAMELTAKDFIDYFELSRKHSEIYRRKYSGREDMSTLSSSNSKSSSESTSSLAIDLTEELKSGDLADAKICSGQSEFPVSTVILSARSPVMKSVFRSDMMEKKTRILDFTHLEVPDDVIWNFLIYRHSVGPKPGDEECVS